MFELKNEFKISIPDIPVQWIPKIELFYPDLPQFPIMYIHVKDGNKRIIACPVSVNYEIQGPLCTASFLVLCNMERADDVVDLMKNELSNRIGINHVVEEMRIMNFYFLIYGNTLKNHMDLKFLLAAFMKRYIQFQDLLLHGSLKPDAKVKCECFIIL